MKKSQSNLRIILPLFMVIVLIIIYLVYLYQRGITVSSLMIINKGSKLISDVDLYINGTKYEFGYMAPRNESRRVLSGPIKITDSSNVKLKFDNSKHNFRANEIVYHKDKHQLTIEIMDNSIALYMD